MMKVCGISIQINPGRPNSIVAIPPFWHAIAIRKTLTTRLNCVYCKIKMVSAVGWKKIGRPICNKAIFFGLFAFSRNAKLNSLTYHQNSSTFFFLHLADSTTQFCVPTVTIYLLFLFRKNLISGWEQTLDSAWLFVKISIFWYLL